MGILISYFNTYKGPIRGGLLTVLASLILILALYSGLLKLGFGIQTARLEIDIHNTQRAFEGTVVENMTVLEALQASAAAGNIRFEYGMNDGKFMIMALDGYDFKSGKKLTFYLNSSPLGSEQVHSVVVKPGDLIEVKTE